ncbi:STAS domain-containing protein [Saccharomonospora piscinae]|uniref:STAS domain-containing protein n=1 Tax=Saccharomonospora piscinae TaxID=687388 RepID=UPI001106601E|nr:STAS domain-containing protein [Saccharomonospora piscinae]TLW92264.1 STAS domain-containing protein [Saccharomonospora piscinae]
MARMTDDVEVDMLMPSTGLLVVSVAGAVDILGEPTVRQSIDSLPAGIRSLVLDLTETTFFGAAGLSVLVHTAGVAQRRHVSWAVVCPPVVLRPLEVTRLDRELPVCSDFAEAVLLASQVPVASS